MKTYFFLIFLTGSIFFFTTLRDTLRTDTLKSIPPSGTIYHIDTLQSINQLFEDSSGIPAKMSEFPSLHPIIVHFAIALIFVAAIIQVFNLFMMKRDISWIIFFFFLVGLVAALLASEKFHPHTTGISEHVRMVLREHDKWAEWTIRTSIASLVLQFIYLFLIRRLKTINVPEGQTRTVRRYPLFMVLITVVMLSSAFCVVRAGHLGAQLVHIEGVGPQGKFLDPEDHD